ncbi:Protein F52B11.2 a [Aphelenchoides avenae]|nr:Protein F52B11.2 a [Aphelenchus avenae]
MVERTILLFDLDVPLTPARQKISHEMRAFMREASKRVHLGVVSGSDFSKIVEQLGPDVDELFQTYEYIFSENGLVGYHKGELLPAEAINTKLGEDRLQEVINFCLEYISTVKLPIKRGTFVEYRKGMLNVSPIGRSCNQEEREQFMRFDKEHGIRETFVKKLEERFSDYGLKFSIGGQISVDIFPEGWDKTYCLKHLTSNYDNIYFFGDKTEPGGNDYELYAHEAVVGQTVTSAQETRTFVTELLTRLKN